MLTSLIEAKIFNKDGRSKNVTNKKLLNPRYHPSKINDRLYTAKN